MAIYTTDNKKQFQRNKQKMSETEQMFLFCVVFCFLLLSRLSDYIAETSLFFSMGADGRRLPSSKQSTMAFVLLVDLVGCGQNA